MPGRYQVEKESARAPWAWSTSQGSKIGPWSRSRRWRSRRRFEADELAEVKERFFASRDGRPPEPPEHRDYFDAGEEHDLC